MSHSSQLKESLVLVSRISGLSVYTQIEEFSFKSKMEVDLDRIINPRIYCCLFRLAKVNIFCVLKQLTMKIKYFIKSL